ncbi:MAG: CHC2 zinc finger domain-containing protein [Desulfuromonadaceae bacterium]|nr:CHC2 zinc finger domain-containing protein [Desulfuromonadaceae bacterium]MDD2857023.1 CHC2 zinc finger domain-containing protein [Desulfuromonadaceae bacterium]
MMNLQRMADYTGLSLSECRTARIEYLTRHIEERSVDAEWLADDGGDLSAHFAQCVMEEIASMGRELQHLTKLAKGDTPRAGVITPEMIESARSYPIEQLIEFDRTGKAIAFCHGDNHPSLSWHKLKNRATCFPCAKSYNGIDILMKRDGCSFQDAVRQLAA